jgi:hypothetical protein
MDMKNLISGIFLVLASTGVVSGEAAAQSFTKPTAEQAIPAPAPDKAQIIFLRTTLPSSP